MLIYWFMFCVAALTASVNRASSACFGPSAPVSRTLPGWSLTAILLIIIIGLRHEVGGDWFNYFRYLEIVEGLSFSEVLTIGDPGYALFNWLSVLANWGVYGVNFFSAVCFVIGLVIFSRQQSRPSLALVAAIPYMVIVVGMGYSRQAIALGLIMIGFVALVNRSTVKFVLWTVLAATFHKSAVIFIPIAVLASSRSRVLTGLWVVAVSGVAYYLILKDDMQSLYTNYVLAQYDSSGAMIRILMNALPAAIFLIRRQSFRFSEIEDRIWFWISIISLLMLAVLIVSPSSTAVDRIALYFIPLQLVIFSRLPEAFGGFGNNNQLWVIVVVLYYALVQFVWLNFATHAYAWLPYNSALFQ